MGQSEELSSERRQTTTTPGRCRQSDGELPRGTALESDACVEDRPRGPDGAQRRGQGVQVELQRQPAGGKPEWTDRERGSVCGQRNRGTGCRAGDVGADPGEKAGDGGRRQGLRHARFRGGVSPLGGDTACRTELETKWRERDRRAHDASPRLSCESKKEEADRRMLWVAEDDCAPAEAASSWSLQGGLDLCLRVCRLQSGAHAKSERYRSCWISSGGSVSHGAAVRLKRQTNASNQPI